MTRTAVGQFDFDDGGTYCGGSEGGKAHGFGVCTGPGGHGEYSGAWQFGFELSGVYTWPNQSDYAGQWMQGKRHGLGVERRGHWIYRGEWTQGFMGRYGVRQSTMSEAKYEGTWTSGLHDGYGLETYSDGGTYQGQWMKGMRHGYGVRKSALLSTAALCPKTKVRRSSLTSVRSEVDLSEPQHLLTSGYPSQLHLTETSAASHIGFFLKGKDHERPLQQNFSFFSRQRLTSGSTSKFGIGDIVDEKACKKKTKLQGKFSISGIEDINSKRNEETDETLTETYIGEWKYDKRSGFGVCERSDGLKYEGEWLENCKTGYGVTLFPDGSKEEGKYKNNFLTEPNKKMLLLRATKLRERIDLAVAGAQKAAQIALQKSDIANSRMESARSKAELAMEVVEKARLDSEKAKQQTSEIGQSEPHSSQTKVSKRLSMPRHSMMDMRPDQSPAEYQEDVKKISIRNGHNCEEPDQTRCNETKARYSIQYQQAEARQEHLGEQLEVTSKTDNQNIHEENKMSVEGAGQPELMNMNHESHMNIAASFNILPRTSERRDVTERYQAVPDCDNETMANNTSRDFNEVDHLAEIENIFSYLAEEEKNMEEQTSGLHKTSQCQQVLSRPSLRNRRDVRCNDLVIANQDLDNEQKPHTHRRRLTMPCIMKYGTVGPVVGRGTGIVMAAASSGRHCMSESIVTETIVIDNGVRKHLEEELEYHPAPLPSNIDPVEEILQPPKDLPKRYRLESVKLSKKAELGSLPNVSMFRRLEGRAIPRHEAKMLCQQKREELQQLKKIDDELRKKALVLKIGDFKEWCGRHGLAIFLIAVNLVLAILFSKLLS